MARNAPRNDRLIGVMLVNPHRMVLSGLQRIIDDNKPRLAVVGTATDCASATLLAERIKPDVVVLDVGLSLENDGHVVQALVDACGTRVLLIGDRRHGEEHDAAILRGACGLVQQHETPDTLIRAIEKVHEGELWLERSTSGRLFIELARRKGLAARDPSRKKIESLTKREQDVLCTLAANPGAANKTLANNLHIGEHTLRNHLSRIYDKLGVPNRVQLYVFAQRHNLSPVGFTIHVNRRP
jgi:DNA-binding NarL/FixJ family response regulator